MRALFLVSLFLVTSCKSLGGVQNPPEKPTGIVDCAQKAVADQSIDILDDVNDIVVSGLSQGSLTNKDEWRNFAIDATTKLATRTGKLGWSAVACALGFKEEAYIRAEIANPHDSISSVKRERAAVLLREINIQTVNHSPEDRK